MSLYRGLKVTWFRRSYHAGRPGNVCQPSEMQSECRHKASPNCKRKTCLIERGLLKPKRIKVAKRRYAKHSQRIGILERDGHQCRYCGTPVSNDTANIDHVKPWKLGGPTNAKNLVTCCQPCNKVKGNQPDWMPKPIGHWDKDLMLGTAQVTEPSE